jgi:hypothetical protein
MTQTITQPLTYPLSPAAFGGALQRALTALSIFVMMAPGTLAQVIDTNALNAAVKDSLTQGVNAGRALTCTGFSVFMDNSVVKFVFGLVLLISLVGVAWAWYQNSRNGGGFSRLFFILVGGLVVFALAGTLYSQFMACK